MSIEKIKCGIKGCNNDAIGEHSDQSFWGEYVTYTVCEEHAWNCLKSEKPKGSGYGINIGWRRF